MSELQILMYVAYAIFFVGTGFAAYRLAKMPVHLRWDLYPIPHEKGRAHYGGSYFDTAGRIGKGMVSVDL